jgi:hypothetical protein
VPAKTGCAIPRQVADAIGGADAEALIAGFALVGALLIVRAFLGFRLPFRRSSGPPVVADIPRGQPSQDAESDEPSADQVYLDIARLQLTLQVSAYDALDTRSASAVGAGSFALPLVLAFLALSGGRPEPLVVGLFLGAVLAYFVLLVSAARASRVRGLEFRPSMPSLHHSAGEVRGSALRRWAAEEFAISVELNRPEVEAKARRVGVALTALYIEGFFVGLAVLASLLRTDVGRRRQRIRRADDDVGRARGRHLDRRPASRRRSVLSHGDPALSVRVWRCPRCAKCTRVYAVGHRPVPARDAARGGRRRVATPPCPRAPSPRATATATTPGSLFRGLPLNAPGRRSPRTPAAPPPRTPRSAPRPCARRSQPRS